MSTAALVRVETVDALYVADRVSPHRAYTPENYLILLGVPIARTGSQTYRAEEVDKDGSLGLSGLVEVHRPEAEVFAPAAVLSFEGKSVVSPHPPQFLTADNDSLYNKGHVQRVRTGAHPETGAPALLADLIVKDAALRGMIEDGHRLEISGGYTYDLDREADGRFVQRNIRGNHVAIVASGRAGSDIRVLDAAPKEEIPMAEEAKAATSELGTLSQIGAFFKGLGLRLVSEDAAPTRTVQATDAESEAVERNRRVNERANSLRSRVEDEDKLEKEDKGAKEPDDEKDDPDKKDIKKSEDARAALDERLIRAVDRLERTVARATGQDADAADAECTCDMPGGKHSKDCPAHEAKDSDLIPVATLHGDEVPENPIPGADAALKELRKLRPLIAQSGDRQAIDGYNEAVRRLKNRGGEGRDGYGEVLNGRKKPDAVEAAEARVGVTARDSREKIQTDFVDLAAKFHRQNPTTVKIEAKKESVQ